MSEPADLRRRAGTGETAPLGRHAQALRLPISTLSLVPDRSRRIDRQTQFDANQVIRAVRLLLRQLSASLSAFGDVPLVKRAIQLAIGPYRTEFVFGGAGLAALALSGAQPDVVHVAGEVFGMLTPFFQFAIQPFVGPLLAEVAVSVLAAGITIWVRRRRRARGASAEVHHVRSRTGPAQNMRMTIIGEMVSANM